MIRRLAASALTVGLLLPGGDVSARTMQQRLEQVGADPSFIQQTVNTMRLQLNDAGTATAISDSSATKKLTSGTRKLVLPQQEPEQGA